VGITNATRTFSGPDGAVGVLIAGFRGTNIIVDGQRAGDDGESIRHSVDVAPGDPLELIDDAETARAAVLAALEQPK
jgi:hypothetical protein